MKFSIFKKYRYYLYFFIFVIPFNLIAESEYTKTYTKTFNLSSGGKVDIANMYGRVNIQPWNKNEVYIKVTITVDATSESRAEENFERVDISFTNSDQYVSAKTSISSKKSSWWSLSSWWDNSDVKIDYEVSMPAGAHLLLAHKYGDATIGRLQGNVQIEQKYGNLTLDQVDGALSLDLSYGNATVGKAAGVTADVAYFKLRMTQAGNVQLQSKYSQVFIENAGEIISTSAYDGYKLGTIKRLQNEGKYDNFEINQVDVVNIVTKYTKLSLDLLQRSLQADLSYGGLEVDRLDTGFEKIDITSKYAGLDIETGLSPSYQLDISCKYTSVQVPENLQTSRDIRDGNQVTLLGHYGASSSKALIRVRSEYGGLKVH